MWWIATALANPVRASAALPGTEVVEAGHGHVGFAGFGMFVEPFSMAGITLGVAPTEGSYLDLALLQSPESPALKAGQLAARLTLADTEPASVAVFVGAIWYEEAFGGTSGSGVAGAPGLALRFGRRRAVDLSIAPVALVSLGQPTFELESPGVHPTLYAFTVGYTRPFSDHVRLRIGWPDGLTLQWRGGRGWLDVSVFAVGAPLFASLSTGLRF